ncbi:MAG TPA: hypothetical protein VIJ92_13310 [Ginsengibacter sp.]
MKTILNSQISILKMLAIILFIFTFSSCKKVSNHCEEWEVTDEYSVYGNCFFCDGNNRTLTLVFCGDGLKDAKAGNTIVMSDDGCCRFTRTFKRLVGTL